MCTYLVEILLPCHDLHCSPVQCYSSCHLHRSQHVRRSVHVEGLCCGGQGCLLTALVNCGSLWHNYSILAFTVMSCQRLAFEPNGYWNENGAIRTRAKMMSSASAPRRANWLPKAYLTLMRPVHSVIVHFLSSL